MAKCIVVRKRKAERVSGWLILSLLLCTALGASTQAVSFMPAFLMFMPLLLPALFMALYYERWQVTLCPKGIACRSFPQGTGVYSYWQITDVYAARSRTLGPHICLTFSNGRRVVLRSTDKNFERAKSILRSHRSIRDAGW